MLRRARSVAILLSLVVMLSASAPASSLAPPSSTIVVGLNAALQKRFILHPEVKLTRGDVHRAESVEEGIGGKGQDVAVALSCLSRPPPGVKLAQFVGTGGEGDAVLSLLKERVGSDVCDDLTVRAASKMRTCTTIVGADSSTELVEPSGIIAEEEIEDLMGRIRAAVGEDENAAGGLCVSGSMPPGCPSDLYAKLYEAVAGEGTLTLVDSVVGVEPLLKSMAAKRGGDDGKGTGGRCVLKLNAAELCRLAGVAKSAGEAEGVTEAELNEAVRGFLVKYGPDAGNALDYLAVTDGRHPAHLVSLSAGEGGNERSTCRLDVVDLSEREGGARPLLYPIGAGDTVSAGTLAAWRRLEMNDESLVGDAVSSALESRLAEFRHGSKDDSLGSVALAFAFGLACGSASCLEQENSMFDARKALSLLDKMASPVLLGS